MNNLYMKQEQGRTYLVYSAGNEIMSVYQLKMITENMIEGLVNCKLDTSNDETVIMYDVTNMRNLRKEYAGTSIEFLEIKALFENIQNALNVGEKYLLEESNFVLDPSYIMRDMETDEIKYIYLPISKTQSSQSVKDNNIFHQLADFLIERVNHRDDKSVSIAYQFYSMSKEETFSIRLFTNIIDKEDIVSNYEAEYKKIVEEPIVNEDVYIDDEESISWKGPVIAGFGSVIVPIIYYYLELDSIYVTYIILIEIILLIVLVSLIIKNIYRTIQQRKNTDESVPNVDISVEDYWSDNQETQFFDDKTTFIGKKQEEPDVCLEWKEKGVTKKYRITHFPIVVGKLINEVDCRIDDPSISRMHVKINNKSGKMSILDLNSTNGTIVDGVRINPGEEIAIGLYSEIMLGQVMLRLV